MKRFTMLLCLCLSAFTLLSAQDTPNQENNNSETIDNQEEFTYTVNQKGDQLIKINLVANLPIAPKKLNIGGSGYLGYSYFFTKSFAVGGTIGFGYSITEGSNMFLFVPILAQATYQFQFRKFEFPFTLGIGGSFENYLDTTYFGLTIKPEIGAYFRYSPEWSFGLFAGYEFMPQWSTNSSYNYLGMICDVGASVRYHF